MRNEQDIVGFRLRHMANMPSRYLVCPICEMPVTSCSLIAQENADFEFLIHLARAHPHLMRMLEIPDIGFEEKRREWEVLNVRSELEEQLKRPIKSFREALEQQGPGIKIFFCSCSPDTPMEPKAALAHVYGAGDLKVHFARAILLDSCV